MFVYDWLRGVKGEGERERKRRGRGVLYLPIHIEDALVWMSQHETELLMYLLRIHNDHLVALQRYLPFPALIFSLYGKF